MKKALTLLLILEFALSACSFSLAEDVTPPPNYQPATTSNQSQPISSSEGVYPLVPPNPNNGKLIYTENCEPCHGSTGQGNGSRASGLPNPVAAIGVANVANQAVPSAWYNVITKGNMQRFMPPFTDLSEGQVWDTIAYVYSLSSPGQAVSQGANLYQQYCAGCHGPHGQGDGPQSVSLPQPPPDLTRPEYMARKSNQDFFQAISAGSGSNMPGYESQLSEQDRWALTDYVRTLGFASSAQVEGVAATATSAPAYPAPEGTAQAQATLAPTQAITSSATTTDTITYGSLTGTITNGSGEALPDGMQVMLHGFDSMQIAITSTTTAKADGTFEFTNVPLKSGRLFVASTDYDKTTYSSTIVSVAPPSPVLPLDITIYGTTTDQSALSADRVHIFFDFSQPGSVQVIELYIMSNTGKKTIVASKPGGEVVSFSLPQGYTNLQFQDGVLGGRYLQTANGFADTASVEPTSGNYQVIFAFNMPYSKKLTLEQPLDLPVNSVIVLLPENGITLNSSLLNDQGTQDVEGATYHMYQSGALQAGATLGLTLSGSAGNSGGFLSSANSRSSLAIGLGALGFVMVFAGFLMYRRNRSLQAAGEPEQPLAPVEPEGEEELMDAIIALDDLYKEGQLPEEAYRQRRAELKQQLKDLTDGKE